MTTRGFTLEHLRTKKFIHSTVFAVFSAHIAALPPEFTPNQKVKE